jgi:hypothetical protein
VREARTRTAARVLALWERGAQEAACLTCFLMVTAPLAHRPGCRWAKPVIVVGASRSSRHTMQPWLPRGCYRRRHMPPVARGQLLALQAASAAGLPLPQALSPTQPAIALGHDRRSTAPLAWARRTQWWIFWPSKAESRPSATSGMGERSSACAATQTRAPRLHN